jgi:formamidopyrimidine-DNA glycosylase
MPELPEVETIKNGLQFLTKKKITKVFLSDKKLRINSTIYLKNLEQLVIKTVERRARYLILNLNDQKSLVIHLGMSGRITIAKSFENLKHDHFTCEFDDGSFLIFNDPRRFGFVDLIETKNISSHPSLITLGCEPLSEEFNEENLTQKLRNKKLNIKTTMMDNKVVVGVGNIYINESLFDTGISPLRAASSLTKNEIKKLIAAIKKILTSAIKLGGSSINDYVDSAGNSGAFQDNFKIYGRENKKCLICNGLIKRIIQNGRSTFLCNNCQK